MKRERMLQVALGLPKSFGAFTEGRAGGSYYFRTRMYQIVGGGVGFVFQLDQMDSDEGRWFVAWNKFSTSHPKE
jgi:hypothetical protein